MSVPPVSTEASSGEPNLHEQERQRRANREAVRSLGLDPYGERTEGLVTLAEAKGAWDEAADKEVAARGKEPGFQDPRPVRRVAGRAMLIRDTGKLVWMNLRDATGDLQIAVSQRDVDAAGFELAKLTDLGDVLVAEGRIMKTRTGEVTLWCSSIHPASKSLVPPPAKHEGLQDIELRYRRRYVDLWANPQTLDVFLLRARLISQMRRFLDDRGFVEVDTPVLQTLAGGAAARPFVTHMNALDIDLYLRVAPELFLKRLLVGGMPRVYEVARNFRNEGVDRSHNPEFSMVEVYEAFGSYLTMMELTESLIRSLATTASSADSGNEIVIAYGECAIDYAQPFDRVTYADLFERAFGFPLSDDAKVRAAAAERGLKTDGVDRLLLVQELFDEAERAIDPTLPTFVMDYPAPLCPLTRSKKGHPDIAERFELFVAGMEIANAYTELNDPDVQEAKFREQLAGIKDEERTFRTIDEDFLHALKVGMPPAGGLGIGVDRLVMLLTGQTSIRDVLLFPLMRPQHRSEGGGAST
ncbi:MAG: lysine--tRNA ligase [Phycisphaeraceae bacterium]|nr:lysine--tRNA ligase [Phycisphaeraceae bacterium]MCW5753951.1 lysine--tRNA ligase [Phycisphaeraceae bacterium]